MIWRWWWERTQDDPVGGLAFALAAFALGAVGIFTQTGPRAKTARERCRALVPPVALTLASFALLGWLITDSRDRFLEEMVRDEHVWRGPDPLLMEQVWLTIFAVLLMVAVPALLFTLSNLTRARLLARAGAMASMVTGLGVAAMLDRIRQNYSFHWFATPSAWARIRSELMGVSLALDVLIFGIAMTTGALVVVVGRRAWMSRPAYRCGLWGAVAVFVVGAACFAKTRGHAYDRHRLVSLQHDHFYPFRVRPDLAPSMMNCEPIPTPVLEISSGGNWFDGIRVELDTLPNRLETVRRNWSIMHPAEHSPNEIVLSVSPSTPVQRLEPWFDAMRDSRYQTVIFAFTSSRVVALGVRGRTDLRGHCGVAISLDHCVIQKRVFMTVEELLRVEPSQCGIVFPRSH